MKKRNASKILLVIAGLFALIGLFCMFANAFYEGDTSTDAQVRNNVFWIMFGWESKNGQTGGSVVVPLVVAFTMLLVTIILPFFAIPLKKKGTTIICLCEAALSIATGVLFFFTVDFYVAANPQWFTTHTIDATGITSIGPGCICVIVFSFLAAASAILACLLANNKQERN